MSMGFARIGASSFRLAMMVVCLLLATAASAQNPPTPASSPSPPPSGDEGKEIGGFRVTQSIELGGRITEVTGSQAMYDTLIDQQTGVRILEQSLTMQSLTHQDVFD